jgi:hydroxymethylbilane synthase
MGRKIIIGTRGSELALWQANNVQAELKKLGVEADLKIIKTTGDLIQNIGFDKMEGKGFFTKEIEAALLDKSVDLAVHSHKDLETTNPEGLIIASVSDRENPSELLIIRKESRDRKLMLSMKSKAIVGTSSARRKTQLLSFRDDIELKDLRGNVPTRINKLREGQYDAIMIAAAGVTRLEIDLSEFHVEELDPREFVSAPAQGVLGLQIREEDKDLFDLLQKNMNHKPTQDRIAIERGVLKRFNGGCQIPLGVYVEEKKGTYHVWGSVADSWDAYPSRVYLTGNNTNDLIDLTVNKLQEKVTNKSVLITRELPKKTFFRTALEKNGYQVTGVGLTTFEQVEIVEIPETDWVFFSSKNCVNHFLGQNPQLHENLKIGSIGGGTDAEVRKRGYESNFIGHSTDTVQIGKDFAKIVGNGSVLFPQSSSSYRTVQKQFENQSNLHEIVAYNSVENSAAVIEKADVVVLTSPTNAMLYFRKDGAVDGVTFIAMGNSTAKTLEENGVTDYILPWNSSVLALIDAIQGL